MFIKLIRKTKLHIESNLSNDIAIVDIDGDMMEIVKIMLETVKIIIIEITLENESIETND